MTTSKPYAANDLSPGALRSSSWTRTLAVWRAVPRAALRDELLLESVTEDLFYDLDELVRFEFADELGSRHLQVTDQHADYFVAGLVAMLAETRAFVRRIPNPFPELVLFPRLLRLELRLRPRLEAALRPLRRARADLRLLYWRARFRIRLLIRGAKR